MPGSMRHLLGEEMTGRECKKSKTLRILEEVPNTTENKDVFLEDKPGIEGSRLKRAYLRLCTRSFSNLM